MLFEEREVLQDAEGEERRRESARFREAVLWYQAAATQGVAAAREGAGFMEAGGRGTERNVVVAFRKWFMLAAQQGLPDSQYIVGMCDSLGVGIAAGPESERASEHCLQKAAVQQQTDAVQRLENLGKKPSAETSDCPVDHLP